MRGKFEPKWEGPYAIEQAYDGGAYQLVDPQGARPMPPINGRFLKKILCVIFFLVFLPFLLALFLRFCRFARRGVFSRLPKSTMHPLLHDVDFLIFLFPLFMDYKVLQKNGFS
jgi:hypothetical protein